MHTFLIQCDGRQGGKPPLYGAYRMAYIQTDKISAARCTVENGVVVKPKWWVKTGTNHRISDDGLYALLDLRNEDWFIDIRDLDHLLSYATEWPMIGVQDDRHGGYHVLRLGAAS